jgi:hypothetical protein
MLRWPADRVNDVAPRDAIVSDDGTYVATFDEGDVRGEGKSVAVECDSRGRVWSRDARSVLLPPSCVERFAQKDRRASWGKGTGSTSAGGRTSAAREAEGSSSAS